MKRLGSLCVILTVALMLAGCASTAAPFRNIDLSGDLDAATLGRYQRESGALNGQTMPTHAGQHMATLEEKNWWPLGLLAYWEKGSVQAMHTSSGEWNYMVSEAKGYGPLATLLITREQAAFDSKGRRLSYMANAGLALGHLFMYHAMGATLEGEDWMEHRTYSVLHHLVNIGLSHGKVSVWFLTSPNPAGWGD